MKKILFILLFFISLNSYALTCGRVFNFKIVAPPEVSISGTFAAHGFGIYKTSPLSFSIYQNGDTCDASQAEAKVHIKNLSNGASDLTFKNAVDGAKDIQEVKIVAVTNSGDLQFKNMLQEPGNTYKLSFVAALHKTK